MKEPFDYEKYLKVQKENIEERINKFGNKLYLEVGGKVFAQRYQDVGGVGEETSWLSGPLLRAHLDFWFRMRSF